MNMEITVLGTQITIVRAGSMTMKTLQPLLFAAAVAEALKVNTGIQTINLAGKLYNCTSTVLLTLKLCFCAYDGCPGNWIDSDGVAAFVEALEVNTGVHTIHLGGESGAMTFV